MSDNQPSSLECPYCGNECKYGVTVCRGCQAEIRYSPTFLEHIGCGFITIILGVVGVLLFRGALNWLLTSIGIKMPQISDSLVSTVKCFVGGFYTLLFIAGLRLASIIMKDPRFFRNGEWKEVNKRKKKI